jgi:hypothetical protein
MRIFIINRFKILIFKTWKHNKNNSMELTKNFIKSKDSLIIEIQNNNYPSKRIYIFILRITDSIFLPGQPSYQTPNDAY